MLFVVKIALGVALGIALAVGFGLAGSRLWHSREKVRAALLLAWTRWRRPLVAAVLGLTAATGLLVTDALYARHKIAAFERAGAAALSDPVIHAEMDANYRQCLERTRGRRIGPWGIAASVNCAPPENISFGPQPRSPLQGRREALFGR